MNFLSVQEPAFVVFGGLFLWVFNPFYFGGHNFLISNPFSTIISVSDALRGGGVQILLGHQKEGEPSPWIQPALSA